MTYAELVRKVADRDRVGGYRARHRGNTGYLTTGPHYDPLRRIAGDRVLRLRIETRRASGRQYRTLYERDVEDGLLEIKTGHYFAPARDVNA